MRIHFLSDLHLEFAPFDLPDVESDVLVLAGDIGTGLTGIKQASAWALPDRPILYVPGNHEYYGHRWPSLIHEMRQEEFGNNIHVLDNDSIVIHGVRFLGTTLWTDFNLYGTPDISELVIRRNMPDYHAIVRQDRSPLQPADTRQAHREARAWLGENLNIEHDGPTVVVTHHAPSRKSLLPRHQLRDEPLSPAFASNLDQFMGPWVALWLHGHIHAAMDYQINGTRIVQNARGYIFDDWEESVTGFDPSLVIEINEKRDGEQ